MGYSKVSAMSNFSEEGPFLGVGIGDFKWSNVKSNKCSKLRDMWVGGYFEVTESEIQNIWG